VGFCRGSMMLGVKLGEELLMFMFEIDPGG